MNFDDLLLSPGVYEEMYERYQKDPSSVDPTWAKMFSPSAAEVSKFGGPKPELFPPVELPDSRSIAPLIDAFRKYGHLLAAFNPLETPREENKLLDYSTYGFKKEDLTKNFPTLGILKEKEAPLSAILKKLKDIYAGKIGSEFKEFVPPEVEAWIEAYLEKKEEILPIETKQMIFEQLSKSELFESFLQTKYVGQKRFSLEGAETIIPVIWQIIERGAELKGKEFVIGMAHRGRLNVLSNILNKSYKEIFSEFDESYQPDSFQGSGDVKYHKGFETEEKTSKGINVKVILPPNPSHLESVDPVVEGFIKGRQEKGGLKEEETIPILVHGDAALSGQGVVYETLQMQKLKGFGTGGTIHLVVNNQIGFTTDVQDGRSTCYCTDLAKAFGSPIFHVNVEDPEGCVKIANLCIEMRQKFHIDAFIDLYGWRKWGHNESDEPAFTQPIMYKQIKEKKSLREQYREQLTHEGNVEHYMADSIESEFKKALHAAKDSLKLTDEESKIKDPVEKPYVKSTLETAVKPEILAQIAKQLCELPSDFTPHPKIKHLLQDRLSMIFVDEKEKGIDWGMGELLAYGTLLAQGISVRLSGQDVERGTFSHRHAVLSDQETNQKFIPLNHAAEKQAPFYIYNSHLSEFAVLGFEFGYSTAMPKGLPIWEAQFGDFANGAQVIIDEYLVSSEQKWGQKSNLTLFLPHGYEGAGPDHSSGRMERFLSAAAYQNIRIVNPSLPHQHFHLLRKQALDDPKPLIVFTPKALLRLPACVSHVSDFTQGSFKEILDDPHPAVHTKTLIFCSGKIYFELKAYAEKIKYEIGTIVRIEQLYPLDLEALNDIKMKYSSAERVIYAQEEPVNMGAYSYLKPYLEELFSPLEYAGRSASSSPAAGISALHKKELRKIMDDIFHRDQPSTYAITGQLRA